MTFLNAAAGFAAEHNPAILTAAPLLAILAYLVYQLYLSPLAKIPGPFCTTLSRLWITKHSWDGDMHRVLVQLHSKHGNLVRNGPNEV